MANVIMPGADPRLDRRVGSPEGLARRVSEIERLPGRSLTPKYDSYRVPLTFATGWTNYNTTNWGVACYSRVGRLIILEGLVTKSGGTPAGGNLIATLPVDFRPAMRLMFASWTGAGTEVAGRVDVDTNGQILWMAGATAETDFTTLSGIVFPPG